MATAIEICSSPPAVSLHAHRQQNNPSKLPTFRFSDVQLGISGDSGQVPAVPDASLAGKSNPELDQHQHQEQHPQHHRARHSHSRSVSTSISKSTAPLLSPSSTRSRRPFTSPGLTTPTTTASSLPGFGNHTRKPPASRSRNGIALDFTGPPPAMSTQRSYTDDHSPSSSNPTTDAWVAQQTISLSTPSIDNKSNPPTQHSISLQPLDGRRLSQPKISPIRQFRPSRNSLEPSPRNISMAQNNEVTLRALEGYSERTSSNTEQDGQNSDDSDLFMKIAKEEELARRASIPDGNIPTRSDSSRSRIGITIQRQSLPPSNTPYQPSTRPRSGSNQDSASGSRMGGQERTSQVLSYRPSVRDRTTALDDINRPRYSKASPRSVPSSPRVGGNRATSPESQTVYGGRRPSLPDPTSVLPPRTSSYRQSNLSYSAPRMYNSSPLVSRAVDTNEGLETPRAAEGTESTASTTAPSTVWDELEDLKSRIHRLELTGKLPATSGAAISHAASERPPTATTTVTTMSTSPKRGRGNSISPIESTAGGSSLGDNHPLLQSALAKSKPLLPAEVYKALEATTSDALGIASMIGSSSQPGPISGSQSTIAGGASFVSDRQVRRKADSMCRSLTELCLALSEGKIEQGQPTANQTETSGSRDSEEQNTLRDSPSPQRQPVTTSLVRMKSTPRPLSRLEARRSNLLASSSPSSRYAPSEVGTPTQTSMAGRRTSLLLRSRRTGTEEPEEGDGTRLRTPSRATTEVGRLKNSPREYISQQPLPDNRGSQPIQSSLPVRRHYVSTSLTNSGLPTPPAATNSSVRKFLDRSTPERDTNSAVGRLTVDRGQRKISIGQGSPLESINGLARRSWSNNLAEQASAGQAGGFQ